MHTTDGRDAQSGIVPVFRYQEERTDGYICVNVSLKLFVQALSRRPRQADGPFSSGLLPQFTTIKRRIWPAP